LHRKRWIVVWSKLGGNRIRASARQSIAGIPVEEPSAFLDQREGSTRDDGPVSGTTASHTQLCGGEKKDTKSQSLFSQHAKRPPWGSAHRLTNGPFTPVDYATWLLHNKELSCTATARYPALAPRGDASHPPLSSGGQHGLVQTRIESVLLKVRKGSHAERARFLGRRSGATPSTGTSQRVTDAGRIYPSHAGSRDIAGRWKRIFRQGSFVRAVRRPLTGVNELVTETSASRTRQGPCQKRKKALQMR